jgi:hypothetical protein
MTLGGSVNGVGLKNVSFLKGKGHLEIEFKPAAKQSKNKTWQ